MAVSLAHDQRQIVVARQEIAEQVLDSRDVVYLAGFVEQAKDGGPLLHEGVVLPAGQGERDDKVDRAAHQAEMTMVCSANWRDNRARRLGR
jgi:hypothetical protein